MTRFVPCGTGTETFCPVASVVTSIVSSVARFGRATTYNTTSELEQFMQSEIAPYRREQAESLIKDARPYSAGQRDII